MCGDRRAPGLRRPRRPPGGRPPAGRDIETHLHYLRKKIEKMHFASRLNLTQTSCRNISEKPGKESGTRSVTDPVDRGMEARLKALEAENRALWVEINKLKASAKSSATSATSAKDDTSECQVVPTVVSNGTELSATAEPWVLLGISRRTYYRRKKI